MKMIQNEYRKIGSNFEFLSNFGHTRGYDSSVAIKKKNISYLFTKFDYDLNLNNFETSKINVNFYKTTNDTFLKVFDPVLNEESTSLKPSNGDSLSSNLDITLSNEKFNLTTGFQAHENLSKKNNDRYQYVLPYYTFDKKLFSNSNLGSFSLNSNGNNVL